jgi:oxygen-independent coproporphyrinogen-3 oxidase
VENCEITLEVNPGTVTPEKLRNFKDIGVNRLSIGVQSLKDENLKILGRIHNSQEAFEIIKAVSLMGFNSVSLDFIYAIPGQTIEKWIEELKEITNLKADHISLYSLIPEPDTPLGDKILSGELLTVSDDDQADMMEQNHRILTSVSYTHYEISNFAKPGHESKHNLKYWHNEDYLGFGSSAFSYIRGRRFGNLRDPREFIERIENKKGVICSSERLSLEKKMGEYMMLALRLSEGVSQKEFQHRFRVDMFEFYKKEIKGLIDSGLLEEVYNYSLGDRRIFIPPRYFPIQSEIALTFIDA